MHSFLLLPLVLNKSSHYQSTDSHLPCHLQRKDIHQLNWRSSLPTTYWAFLEFIIILLLFSHQATSDSSQPHGLQPTRLLCPWDLPGKCTGVGCHCLLRLSILAHPKWPVWLTFTKYCFYHVTLLLLISMGYLLNASHCVKHFTCITKIRFPSRSRR